MRIQVSRAASLVDQLVAVTVSGCRSLQPVTLHLSASEPYGTFSSHGHYLADASGEVCTARDRSVGGTYVGLDPMGLFWSMRPDQGQRTGLRFLKRNASEPITMRLRALTGHLGSAGESLSPHESPAVTEVAVQRTYLSPGVTKTPVETGRLRGALFSPAGGSGDGGGGARSYPAVLDLFGLGGGLMEHRAALLASKGFTVLALAYFGHADLPSRLEAFDLEYFVEAIRFLLEHPKVRGPRIGIVGTSAGANMASELAVHRSEVACVVWLNGMQCRILAPVKYFGRTLKALHPSYDRSQRTTVGGVDVWSFKDCYDVGCTEEHMVRVEDSDAEFLFISSMDDEGVPNYTGRLLAERLVRAGKRNYRLLQYPGAGHLLEPPYSPLNRMVYQGAQSGVVNYGGDPYWHNLAQIDAWKETQDFLKRHLE